MPANTDLPCLTGRQAAQAGWFMKARWGVFCHYLGAAPSSGGGAELTAEQWNAQVDSFDVGALADQLHSIGTTYFFLTLGQNSGHYCSPNATYDCHVGIRPSKCSRRDLPADLHEALDRHGIRLMLYLPSGAPAADPQVVAALGWEWGVEGGWGGRGTQRTGKRLAEFQVKWEQIVRDWSLRFGRRVHGWWIDGCYFADEMYRHDDPPNFESLAAALKAGNGDALVAFNPGVKVPVICHTEHEDYTAGEIAEAFPTCPGRWVRRGGRDCQYHVLSYLGERWCGGQPRFPDEFPIGYTKHVNSRGGVVTWDVPITKDGAIPQPFVDQLQAISSAVRNSPLSPGPCPAL